MNDDDIIADLIALIDKDDPLCASLITPLNQIQLQNMPRKSTSNPTENDSNCLNIEQRNNIINSHTNKKKSNQPKLSSSRSAKNLLPENSVNKMQIPNTKNTLLKTTRKNSSSRNAITRTEMFVLEDEIKEETEFDDDSVLCVNPAAHNCNTSDNSNTNECTFIPNINPIKKSKKLQEYLSKNPYERLSKVKKVVNDKNKKRSIKNNSIKGERSIKSTRMGSPTRNDKIKKNNSTLKPEEKKSISSKKGSFRNNQSIFKTSQCSRNCQSPTLTKLKTQEQTINNIHMRNHLDKLIKRIEQEKELKEVAVNKRRQRLEQECIYNERIAQPQLFLKKKTSIGIRSSSQLAKNH